MGNARRGTPGSIYIGDVGVAQSILLLVAAPFVSQGS